jgi:hypothetical protein
MTKQYSNFAIWLTHPSGRKQCVWEKLVEGDTLLDKDMDRCVEQFTDAGHKVVGKRTILGSKGLYHNLDDRLGKQKKVPMGDIYDD